MTEYISRDKVLACFNHGRSHGHHPPIQLQQAIEAIPAMGVDGDLVSRTELLQYINKKLNIPDDNHQRFFQRIKSLINEAPSAIPALVQEKQTRCYSCNKLLTNHWVGGGINPDGSSRHYCPDCFDKERKADLNPPSERVSEFVAACEEGAKETYENLNKSAWTIKNKIRLDKIEERLNKLDSLLWFTKKLNAVFEMTAKIGGEKTNGKSDGD